MKKAWLWFAGLVAAVLSLAAAVSLSKKQASQKATKAINEGENKDAALAERRKMNAGELAQLKENIAKIPLDSRPRTEEEVTAELRKRGRIK